MSKTVNKKSLWWGITFICLAIIPYLVYLIDPSVYIGDEVNLVTIPAFFFIIAGVFLSKSKSRSPKWCWMGIFGLPGIVPIIMLKNRGCVWCVKAGDNLTGPFSYLELQTAVQNGEIRSDSLIGKQGKSKRKPITKVFPQLFFDEIPSLRLRRKKMYIISSVVGVIAVTVALVAGFFIYAFSEEGQFVLFRFPPYLTDDEHAILYYELEPLLVLVGENPECNKYLDSYDNPEWNYTRYKLKKDPRGVLRLQNAEDYLGGDKKGLAKAHAKYLLSEYYRYKKVFGFYPYNKFARKLLEEAATEGSIYAQLEMADRWDYGKKQKNPASTRLKYYRMAADQGCYQACLFVGSAFCEGDVVPLDVALGREYFSKAFESKLFINEYLSREEFDRAIPHIIQMAEDGNAAAQCWLGQIYIGRERFKEGLAWLEKPAEQNYAKAQYRLGLIYLYGWYGAQEDRSKGVEYLAIAAQNGSIDAQEMLGSTYLSGWHGVEKNESLALKHLKSAARDGHLDAQKELSDFYYEKAKLTGNSWDYIEAARWLEKAWRNGEISILPDLQWSLLKGERYDDAYKYLRMTARYESKAQYLLGWMLLNGKGIDRDLEGAIAWLKKSAINGNYPDAQHLLSSCYKEGIGVLEDYRESYAWSVVCAKNGGDQSMKDFLQKELSMSQVTDGQARAKELLAEIESAAKERES